MKQLTGPMATLIDTNIPAMKVKCLTHTTFHLTMVATFDLKATISSLGTDKIPVSRSNTSPNQSYKWLMGPTYTYQGV